MSTLFYISATAYEQSGYTFSPAGMVMVKSVVSWMFPKEENFGYFSESRTIIFSSDTIHTHDQGRFSSQFMTPISFPYSQDFGLHQHRSQYTLYHGFYFVASSQSAQKAAEIFIEAFQKYIADNNLASNKNNWKLHRNHAKQPEEMHVHLGSRSTLSSQQKAFKKLSISAMHIYLHLRIYYEYDYHVTFAGSKIYDTML